MKDVSAIPSNKQRMNAIGRSPDGAAWRVHNPGEHLAQHLAQHPSMRIDAPDDESAIRQPTDNIPPRDVIRTFMATPGLRRKRLHPGYDTIFKIPSVPTAKGKEAVSSNLDALRIRQLLGKKSISDVITYVNYSVFM